MVNLSRECVLTALTEEQFGNPAGGIALESFDVADANLRRHGHPAALESVKSDHGQHNDHLRQQSDQAMRSLSMFRQAGMGCWDSDPSEASASINSSGSRASSASCGIHVTSRCHPRAASSTLRTSGMLS